MTVVPVDRRRGAAGAAEGAGDRGAVDPPPVVAVEPPMVDPPVLMLPAPVQPVTVAAVEPPVAVAPSEPLTVPVGPPVFGALCRWW